MEVLKPLGGGKSHALTPESGYVAHQLIGALDAPDTLTPNHGQPVEPIAPQIDNRDLHTHTHNLLTPGSLSRKGNYL